MLSGAEKTNENTHATFKPESTLGISHHYLSVLLTSESLTKSGRVKEEEHPCLLHSARKTWAQLCETTGRFQANQASVKPHSQLPISRTIPSAEGNQT